MSTNALHPLTLALSLASPAGARNRLSILIHHRVLPTTDPLQPEVPDCSTFDWQMRLLARHFNVLPLAEAGRRLREGSLPARAAAISARRRMWPTRRPTCSSRSPASRRT